MAQPTFAPRKFRSIKGALKAIGNRTHIDYMVRIKGVFDKHQRFAFQPSNFSCDLKRSGFGPGDIVKVWLPQ